MVIIVIATNIIILHLPSFIAKLVVHSNGKTSTIVYLYCVTGFPAATIYNKTNKATDNQVIV